MTNQQSSHFPTVAVVMVSYNTSALTTKALQAVFASEKVDLSVYLIDNASADRTLSTLRRRFKVRPSQKAHRDFVQVVSKKDILDVFPGVADDAQLVSSTEAAKVNGHQLFVLLADKNLGFGRANNLAAAWSDADYILFLNSDTQVKPDAITNLVGQFRRLEQKESFTTSVVSRWQKRLDNLGILAAQLLNSDGSVQRQGGALPRLGNIFRWISFLDDVPGFSQVFESYQYHESEIRSISRRQISKVGWVGGTAMMVSRPCLAEVGGFDPAIFMYGEDVDLCWRATNRHWDVAITSEAEVTHVGSASSSRQNAILGEIGGLVYLWEKHRSHGETRLLKLILNIGLRWRILIFGILHRYGQQRIYRQALALLR